MKKVKTKINQGSELLVPRELWVPEVELQGDESKVLTHPIIKKAFSQILKLHKPKHEIAFVSLCTATRPYSQSRKWKKYIEEFGNEVEIIFQQFPL